MSSLKIIIAAAIVIFATNLLAGCNSRHVSEVAMGRIESAQEMKKSVHLSLREMGEDQNTSLRLVLENPEKESITSVQAWLTYNPDLLKGVSIDTHRSAFSLMAPYKNDFDEALGMVMIGRSNPMPVSEEEIVIADIQFERLTKGVAMIDSYDYRSGLEGHLSANVLLDSVPVNLLVKPESPLLILN